MWPSPDGRRLVYATFNDSEVGQIRWTSFSAAANEDRENSSPYPRLETMRYPKVRAMLLLLLFKN